MSISIYSQAGAFCEGALAFPNSNSCFNNQVITGDAQWYGFVAGETTETVELTNLDSLPGHVHRMEFYTGTCAGNNLILTDSVEVTPTNDTLLAMTETGLTIGTTYYIKLIRGADGCGKCTLNGANYNLCLLAPVIPPYTICGLLPGSTSYTCCPYPPAGDTCFLFTVCVGTPIEFFGYDGFFYGGSPAYTFASSGGSVAGNVVTFSASGTYYVGAHLGTSPFLDEYAYAQINVVDSVPVSFTASPNPVCQGQQICFTNTTAPPFNDNNYEFWDFGDGNTQIPPCFLATCDCNTYTTAGTYTVTLTMTGGCPGSATQEVIVSPPSIKVVSNVACQGTNTTFNIIFSCLSPSDIDNWAWNWGDGTSSSGLGAIIPFTHTYPASGSYTATLTVQDLSGNFYIINVNVNVAPLPPAPIIATPFTDIVCSAGTSATYTISNFTPPASSYSVAISSGIASVSPVNSSGQFTVIWGSTAGSQAVITFTDPKGCQSFAIIDIMPCCAAPVGFQNFVNSNTSAMIAISGYTTFFSGYNRVINKTFYINGTFTVDQNLQLENCDVFLGADAKIVLNPGKRLIVHNSHLRACDLMWDGIYVSYSNSFVEVRTSIIEDGKNAVVSENGGGHSIRSSLFNKNLISVIARNYSGIFPTVPVATQITGNSFSCRDYSGLSLATLLAINMAGTYDTYPLSTLNGPYTGERSDIGCEISNITNATTIYSIDYYNIFDYLNTGIYSYRSNLMVLRNTFKNIQTFFGGTTGTAIAGIYAVGKPFFIFSFANYKLTVGGYGGGEGNTFTNCLTGVYTITNMNVNVYKNDFNFITEYGVRCENSQFANGINIKNNTMTNFKVGVRCRNNTFCNTQIDENKLKITSTFFFPSSTGIQLEELSTTSTVSDYRVFNNKIQVVKYGIRAFLLNGAILDNNKIEVRPSGTTIGIEVIANYGAQITTNDVQSIPATYTTSVGGIYASMSPLSYIYCNTAKDMGYGIKCAGSMASDIFKNTMQNDYYGFWLDNNGFVGLQDRPGFAGQASYNRWINPFPGARSRTTNFTDGSVSPFVFRTLAVPPPPAWVYYPTATADFTSIPLGTTGTLTGPLALASCPTVPPPALLKSAQDLAMEMIGFPGNDANTKWLSKQGLYHNIMSDSIDVSGDAILQAFVNLSAIENVEKLNQLNKTLVDGSKYNTTDMLVAQSLSSSIVPNNDIETNQKLIADIIVNNYLSGVTNYSATQLNDLRILANKCPFTDGIGVYQARVLLSPIDSIGTEYLNSCETDENRSAIFNSESVEEENTALMVYPNPASDQLTINYQLSASDVAVFEIYNVVGEIVLTRTLNTSEGEQKLPLSNLNSGIYFYKYSINDRIVSKDKLVIVK